MTDLHIPTFSAPLFTDKVARVLETWLGTGAGSDLIGVSDGINLADDRDVWQRDPTAWRGIDARTKRLVVSHPVEGAITDIAEPGGAVYFTVFTGQDFNALVAEHRDRMAAMSPIGDGEWQEMRKYIVLCLSFGVLIMSKGFPAALAEDIETIDGQAPTQDLVGSHIRLILDARFETAHDAYPLLRRARRIVADLVRTEFDARAERQMLSEGFRIMHDLDLPFRLDQGRKT